MVIAPFAIVREVAPVAPAVPAMFTVVVSSPGGAAFTALAVIKVARPAAPAGAYEFTWNSSTVLNGSHVLAAIARDAAGNQRTASVSVMVANDTTPPTVALTSPADAATITETVTLEASALDDVGVVGVQFTLDGVNLGAEHPAAPYASAWNSATVPASILLALPNLLAATASWLAPTLMPSGR